ncbi:MAG: dockerin type I repeat-containing protein, partial [Phycisphaerales bacterium]|nr:dockerin type I repeat-containing protein [Phycisphaerales bacterium]
SSSPFGAPLTTYSTLSGASVTILLAFDFETASGWFVTNQSLQSGAWTLGIPTGAGLFGAPVADYDGSGQCYLTGTLSESDDVDGGPTRLWSPAVNFSTAENPVIQYARWFTNSNQDEDRLVVELANNSAVNFVEFESVADSAGWSQRNALLNDVFPDPGTIRIRFSATDNPNNSRTEAAIDAVIFLDIGCETGCVKGDVNLDGLVDGRDVEPFTAAILNPPPMGADAFCAADVNSDDVVTTVSDLAAFANCLLSGGCP